MAKSVMSFRVSESGAVWLKAQARERGIGPTEFVSDLIDSCAMGAQESFLHVNDGSDPVQPVERGSDASHTGSSR